MCLERLTRWRRKESIRGCPAEGGAGAGVGKEKVMPSSCVNSGVLSAEGRGHILSISGSPSMSLFLLPSAFPGIILGLDKG